MIVGFNGQPVDEQSQFARLIADAPIGSVARLEVLRAGQAPARSDVTVSRLIPPAVQALGSATTRDRRDPRA